MVAVGASVTVLVPGAVPGCDERAGAEVESVRIGDRWFHLELAADPDTRFRGLSGREHIEPDGGMLFVFPRPQRLNFVMRDCPVAIDIVFLDGSGRVLAMHAMEPEAPRGPGEGAPGEVNLAYENRLKKYPSRFAAQFAIELRGGTLAALGLKEGDRIQLDVPRLKRLAR